MFTNFGPAEAAKSLEIIKQLRANGISAEIYPDNAKMKNRWDVPTRSEFLSLQLLEKVNSPTDM